MRITEAQKEKIINLFPKQRGTVKVDNILFLNALIYITDLERIFCVLPEEQIPNKKITVVSLDSTSVKVYPNATETLKKRSTGA